MIRATADIRIQGTGIATGIAWSRHRVFLFLLPILLCIPNLNSQSGEGSITGFVKVSGTPPAIAAPAQVKPADARVCGREMSDESIVLESGGALRWAMVYLESSGLPALSAPAKKTGAGPALAISNLHCRFVPHVQTATVGSTLLVRNDDDILHNTHAYLEPNTTLFNLGLPFKGTEVPKRLTKTGMIRFKCDAGHTWMSAFLLVLNHAFHTVTDAEGRFRIESVPAGKHAMKIWHEKLGTKTVDVQVDAGKETRIMVEFKTP